MGKICMIGGGAAGMTAAVLLARRGKRVTLLERGPRLGRKLSQTGNGQGNVTNVSVSAEKYFSDDAEKVSRILQSFGWRDTVGFLEDMGGIFLPDARGRVYPLGRQASAVTDLLRAELDRLGAEICLNTHVNGLTYDGDFRLTWEGGQMYADAVLLCAGGKAARQFGTDGTAYALAEGFGHTVTPLSPTLVRLRCEQEGVRGLKGIRIEALLRLMRQGTSLYETQGDVLFTEDGVSGDAVFRASSYAEKGDLLLLDLAPSVPYGRIRDVVSAHGLLGIVPNAVGRKIEASARGEERARLVKAYPLTVTGKLGFDYAQVTRGGIPLSETDDTLQSKFRKGLYFAGEILNVDGECGGYNLHWAFASAHTAAEALC